MDRRHFLRLSGAGALMAGLPGEAPAVAPSDANWDRGRLRRLLPTVSDREILIKASFDAPLAAAPTLRVGSLALTGRMSDTRGELWQFQARGLSPGGDNESFLKRAAAPQIAPVYGTDFRSTPVFFIQDDHDYFENDDAYDEIVTFPPDHFMTQMARATQSLYYPEFLPDAKRPAGLPGASSAGRALPVSESYGTLRYEIPMRLMRIDRENTTQGKTMFFWGVGKPIIHRSAAYFGFAKVGKWGMPGTMVESQGCFMRRDNLLTEKDPKKIRGELPPDGDEGLRAPKGPVSDEANPVSLSDGSFYATYRTIDGYNCHAYSRDGGQTWTPPEYATYTPAHLPGSHRIKHPRAANFVRKFSHGKDRFYFPFLHFPFLRFPV